MSYVMVVLAFISVILLNIIAVRYVISRALKKIILPQLEEKELLFIRFKWLGFFNSGDFKNEALVICPAITGGSPFVSIYIDIYYQKSTIIERITARIDTSFLFIRKAANRKAL